MGRPEEIESHRNYCKELSNDDLIRIMNESVPHSVKHIAAKQELESRKEQDSRAAISTSRKSLWIAVAALLISVLALCLWIANVFGKFGQSSEPEPPEKPQVKKQITDENTQQSSGGKG